MPKAQTGGNVKKPVNVSMPVKSDGTKDKRYTVEQIVKQNGTRDMRTNLASNKN
jgi:hypothetical protein